VPSRSATTPFGTANIKSIFLIQTKSFIYF
jgi:hypothetical protein